MDSQMVWAPHTLHGFAKAVPTDFTPHGMTVKFLPMQDDGRTASCGGAATALSGGGDTASANYSEIFPAGERDAVAAKPVDDNCSLLHLNEASLLDNLRSRYFSDQIYTYTANILISVNPYRLIEHLYAKQTIQSYRGRSLGSLPPHIYAIADKCYRDMCRSGQSQAIIVSGESGSGKTEATKYILHFLTECYGVATKKSAVQTGQLAPATAGGATASVSVNRRLIESNPLLEAFGNAATQRNNNSSRFGKFVQMRFAGTSGGGAPREVVAGHVSHYLIEKSRICRQTPGERNYHIFYQLLAGLPEHTLKQVGLRRLAAGGGAPSSSNASASPGNQQSGTTSCYQFLQQEGMRVGKLDATNFQATDRALSDMGVATADKWEIYKLVLAVIHLGNVCFTEATDTTGGSKVDHAQCADHLKFASHLLGLQDPANSLEQTLTTRKSGGGGGGGQQRLVEVALRPQEAANARDALAKFVYSRLFDYIVNHVINNQALSCASTAAASNCYIGILDIAGFEFYERNDFEQFCINYCNEKLQQFFNQRVLKDEQQIYQVEHLSGIREVLFIDNQDCLDLIESKRDGIIDLLDEESKLPKSTAEHFTNQVYSKNSGHVRLNYPRKSKLKSHREIADHEGLLIRHYAGAVCYTTDQFVAKNNDALHSSLITLLESSSSTLIRSLVQMWRDQNDAGSHVSSSNTAGKLAFISVFTNFKQQLGQLMHKLNSTGTSFIRCIKPNSRMQSYVFEGANCLTQLQCAGMTDVLQLMHHGYPTRIAFQTLYSTYQSSIPAQLKRLDPRLFCKMLLKAVGLKDEDFQFGTSRVFFRAGKMAEFDRVIKSDAQSIKQMLSSLRHWLLRYRWRQAQYCVWEVIKLRRKIAYRQERIVRVQKSIRMWLARRKFAMPIKTLRKLTILTNSLDQVSSLMSHLEQQRRRDEWNKKLIDVRKQFEAKRQLVKKLALASRTASGASGGGASAAANQQYRQICDAAHKISEKLMQSVRDEIDKERKEMREQQERERERERAEELRRIEARMAEEKRRQEEEAARLAELEKARQQKCEFERQRRQSLEHSQRALKEKREKQEKQQSSSSSSSKKEGSPETSSDQQRRRQQEMLELERRDRELALRLAEEDEGRVEQLERAKAVLQEREKHAIANRMDLTSLKYSEIRDFINTSCDVQLIEACRAEFHRRIRVYQQWKENQQQQQHQQQQQRDEQSSSSASAAPKKSPVGSASGVAALPQRYFRLNFPGSTATAIAALPSDDANQSRTISPKHSSATAKPSSHKKSHLIKLSSTKKSSKAAAQSQSPSASVRGGGTGGGSSTTGWWMAHFDGNYVARQIEYQPSASVSGSDSNSKARSGGGGSGSGSANSGTTCLLIAGVNDADMCELHLDDTGLTLRKGAEISADEFQRVWESLGGNDLLCRHRDQLVSSNLKAFVKTII